MDHWTNQQLLFSPKFWIFFGLTTRFLRLWTIGPKIAIVVVGVQGFATLRERLQFLLHNKYIFEEKGAEQPSRADALVPCSAHADKAKAPT